MARRWSYALAFMTAVALATTACGGSGKQSATPDFTRQAEPSTSVTATSAPATATAAATPSPPVPGPEEYEGTDVRVLRVGGPGDIGSDTVVYYHVLCYACGPGGTNLYRAYRDPITRELRIDDLLSLDGRYDGKFRHALAADYQAGHMVVGVCTRGYCGGEGAASDDAEAIALRSRDGGVTWTEIGPLPPNTSFTGISEGEAVAVTHTNSPTREIVTATGCIHRAATFGHRTPPPFTIRW